MPLRYTSAISVGANENYETFHPNSLCKNNPNSNIITPEESITLKITTPLFYALIALDPNPATFITSSVRPSSPHPPTFHTSHPAILTSLLSPSQLPVSPSPKSSTSTTTTTASTNGFPLTSRLRGSLLTRLRRNSHPLDQHSTRLPPILKRRYRTSVLKLLLSDTLFFGFPIIVDVLNAAVTIALCYLYASTLSAALARWRMYGVAGSRGSAVAPDRIMAERALWMDVPGLMGIHAWRLLTAGLGIII